MDIAETVARLANPKELAVVELYAEEWAGGFAGSFVNILGHDHADAHESLAQKGVLARAIGKVADDGSELVFDLVDYDATRAGLELRGEALAPLVLGHFIALAAKDPADHRTPWEVHQDLGVRKEDVERAIRILETDGSLVETDGSIEPVPLGKLVGGYDSWRLNPYYGALSAPIATGPRERLSALAAPSAFPSPPIEALTPPA